MGRESLRIQASLSPVEGARIRKELGGRVSESWLVEATVLGKDVP